MCQCAHLNGTSPTITSLLARGRQVDCYSSSGCEKHRQVQEIPEEESALIERVRKILLEANGQNERLTSSAASECLANAGLGLRFVQVPAIMSAVEEGEDGLVEVEEVANAVAGIMCALNQMHSWQQEGSGNQTVTDFKVTRQAEGIATVAGLDADGFKVRSRGRSTARILCLHERKVHFFSALRKAHHHNLDLIGTLCIVPIGLHRSGRPHVKICCMHTSHSLERRFLSANGNNLTSRGRNLR